MVRFLRTRGSTATLAAAAALLVWSCSSSTDAGTPASAVTVSPDSAALASINETLQLTGTALDDGGNPIEGKTFGWTSSDELVARVDAAGLVTARGNGSATITATVDGVSSTSAITVQQVAAALTFTRQPAWTPADSTMPSVQASIVDAMGSPVATATDNVTVTLSGSGAGVLSGTTTQAAVGGVASFTDLSVDVVAAGYTLGAGNGGLTLATSDAFEVVLAFTQIAVGERSTCGLIASGAAYCWGTGASGELGNGSDAASDRPVLVSGGHTFTQIDVGGNGACGLAVMAIYCWGDNSFGQIGNGTSGGSVNTPTLVSGSHAFTSVSAASHRCGITTVGDAYCWGSGFSGQLGDGNSSGSSTPVLVSGGHSWSVVTTGWQHTCGVRATVNGEGFCWGLNTNGQLGLGRTDLGTNVPASMSPVRNWVSITAGRTHSCGITDATEPFCWGDNLRGQLGNGQRPQDSNQARRIQSFTFTLMHAGSLAHGCGIAVGGALSCWGAGTTGQLGTGGTGDQSNPAAVSTLSAPSTYQDVQAGSFHTCGIAANGGAHCWGQDLEGSLGHPGRVNATTPVAVAAPTP